MTTPLHHPDTLCGFCKTFPAVGTDVSGALICAPCSTGCIRCWDCVDEFGGAHNHCGPEHQRNRECECDEPCACPNHTRAPKPGRMLRAVTDSDRE